MQVIWDALLDLLFTRKEQLVEDVKVKERAALAAVTIWLWSLKSSEKWVRQAELQTLVFRKAPFGLFRDLPIINPWKIALEGKGNQESSLIFKVNLLKAQEESILTCRKLSKHCWRPAWMKRELLTRRKHSKEHKKGRSRDALSGLHARDTTWSVVQACLGKPKLSWNCS